MAFDLRPTLSDVLFDNGISLTLATIYNRCGFFCFGYFGRLAHYISGEPTFQSSYSNKNKFGIFSRAHIFLAAIDGPSLSARKTFGELVCPARRYFGHEVDNPQDEVNMETILSFVLTKPTKEHTTHWWYHRLKGKVKESFDGLANAPQIVKMFQRYYAPSIYDIEVLEGKFPTQL